MNKFKAFLTSTVVILSMIISQVEAFAANSAYSVEENEGIVSVTFAKACEWRTTSNKRQLV